MSSINEIKEGLTRLSKEELVALAEELIFRLQKVESQLAQYQNPNTPSSQQRFKANSTPKDNPSKPRFPGAPTGHKGSGIHIPKPDRIEEHKINDKNLTPIGKRTRYVIDFVQSPIHVTKHIIIQYRTPSGEIIEPPLDLPKGIYGKNLQAFGILLKSIGLSYEKISSVMRALRPDISICPATLLNQTDAIAKNLQFERDKIQETIRTSPYVNADETGMRCDGKNGYNWGFFTPTHALYETDKSRSRDVPNRVLGEDYKGIVVSDGYVVYEIYKQQRCWAHVLREGDDLVEIPESITLIEYLHSIFEKAKAAKEIPLFEEREKIALKLAGSGEIQHVIACLGTISGCKKFAKTLKKAAPNLFRGVLNPAIPLTNNHAERMLRPLILHRKIMGCYRNEKGKRFFENVMSNFMTWKLQKRPIYKSFSDYAI